MMNKNSNRKPFSDLTNKVSAGAVRPSADVKPRPRKNFPASSSSKISQEKPSRPETKVAAVVPLQVRQSPVSSGSVSASGDERQQQREPGQAAVQVMRRPNLTNYGSLSQSGDHLETIAEEPEVTTSGIGSSLSADSSPFFPRTGADSSPVFLYPPPSPDLMAFVMEPGYISLRLSHGIVLDISNDLSVRLHNPRQQSSIAMSRDSRDVAVIHPQGRALVYHPRVEIQVGDHHSVKNAKFYSKGISFTANNLALVYLLDEAGVRSTSDIFHDIQGTNTVEILFKERCGSQQNSTSRSCEQLERTRYWRNLTTGVHCWEVDDLAVRQSTDGLVTVERRSSDGSFLRVSPTNGKVKLVTPSVQASASLGEESHFFLRSGQKRLHYNGNTGVFVVRSSGQSAGFNEVGNLEIH